MMIPLRVRLCIPECAVVGAGREARLPGQLAEQSLDKVAKIIMS